ncbi:hypothetical protein BJY21_002710 [Kineosphaera limosa]|nr:hypothetical protein [Kineosphaera limosa]NYE01526.1 hypothetical protein [Kineosphaera limosa]
MTRHDGGYDPFEDPDRITVVDRDEEDEQPQRRRWFVVGGAGVAAAAVLIGGVYTLASRGDDTSERVTQRVALSVDGLPTQASAHLVSQVEPFATAALTGSLPLPDGITAAAPDVVPERAAQAYRRAEATMAQDQSSCRVPWWLVAAVGKVESNHANGQADKNGNVVPALRGARLDGQAPGTKQVLDTDGGRLDGDALYDRPMGPLQLLPGTWELMARDGNGDGIADPDNIDDAALTAATFLCSSGQDLSSAKGLATGVLYTNDRADYAANVLSWASYYRGGTTPPAVAPVPSPTTAPEVRSRTTGTPPITETNSPTSQASRAATGSATAPAPTAAPVTPRPAVPTATPTRVPTPTTAPTPTRTPTQTPTVTPTVPATTPTQPATTPTQPATTPTTPSSPPSSSSSAPSPAPPSPPPSSSSSSSSSPSSPRPSRTRPSNPEPSDPGPSSAPSSPASTPTGRATSSSPIAPPSSPSSSSSTPASPPTSSGGGQTSAPSSPDPTGTPTDGN